MATPAVSVHRPTYIAEMMERLGIEPGSSGMPHLGVSYATAFHRCEACEGKLACRDWLDSMPKSVTSAPSFCPNADILFELRASQSAHNRGFASIEPDRASKSHAHIADLERFEDELDELLLRKSDDDPMFAELKRRRMQLRAEIERLRSKVAKRRPN